MSTHITPGRLAVVVDAGLLPAYLRHTVERDYGHTYRKEGWIALRWERWIGGMENEYNDPTGVRDVTLLVSEERALQAMSNLARDKLVI